MLSTKYSPWPSFSEAEAKIAADVLLSNRVNYWTGTIGKEFEQKFAEWCESNYAVAVANGTLALELALRALEIGEGDEVIVPSRTFMATASAVAVLGAVPIFSDIDVKSQNIEPQSVAERITDRTKAVICVHLAGWPCDIEAIRDACGSRDIKIVEDCAQAHGARYKGRPVGTLGDIAAWSFCQDKIMTTAGEGGMVTTNSEPLFRRVWEFKDHGKSYDAVFHRQHATGFHWLHESIGSNYRITEVQAAIGLYQLTEVDAWVLRRRAIAARYANVFERYDFITKAIVPNDIYHAYYRYYTLWDHPHISRDQFVDLCSEKSIPVYQGSCPEVYLEKAFEGTPSRPEKRLPNARSVGERSLMFLTHPSLRDDEVTEICETLDWILGSL